MGEIFPTAARPAVARVDLAALRANYACAARLAAGADVIAVVKADAYGHGALPVARTLHGEGCRAFAVATVEEAAELAEAGLGPAQGALLLVLGGVHDAGEADAAVALAATPVVHHAAHVPLLAEAARRRETRLPVHVEIDTGMRRMGVREDEAEALLAAVAAAPELRLDGVFTHFASAEEEDLEFTRRQLDRFDRVLEEARAAGLGPLRIHAANSAALLAHGELVADRPPPSAVRVGLMLYGVAPGPHRDAPLAPVMTLAARVAHVRRLEPGETVGYGGTWRAERATRIATLPLGYADGVPRNASSRGSALLRGRRCPFAGRVSMDFVGVDVGDGPAEIGDEAILFGTGAGGGLPIEEAAEAADTIPYELLVRVGARVPRVLVDASDAAQTAFVPPSDGD